MGYFIRYTLASTAMQRVNTLPVEVEPVNEILATRGSVQRTSPTAGAFSLEQGTTLNTPGGIPACTASCTHIANLIIVFSLIFEHYIKQSLKKSNTNLSKS